MTFEFKRSFPLEDIRILTRAQGAEYADGRTVEAYAAVFDRAVPIEDGQGRYMEIIDRTAFNKAIEDARPQGNRTAWKVPVFYNHGMTIHGTPSDRGSGPIGVAVDIRADEHGLFTVSRYSNTPLADEVLESIRSGAISEQSFSGRIIRSNPNPPRNGYRANAKGELSLVRRLELGLREYGPSPFAAYPAAIVGMRAALSALLSTTQQTLAELGPEPEEPDESDTPDPGAVPEEPPAADEHSSRDLHRAAVLERIAAAKRTRPDLFGERN